MENMLDRIKEIDDELTELKTAPIEGTPCEVYTRIVGYYRSVRNWNPGKKAEYPERVMFEIGDLPEITAKPVNNDDDIKLPFGIEFDKELTASRIA